VCYCKGYFISKLLHSNIEPIAVGIRTSFEYCFHQSKIKFISSHRRVISRLYNYSVHSGARICGASVQFRIHAVSFSCRYDWYNMSWYITTLESITNATRMCRTANVCNILHGSKSNEFYDNPIYLCVKIGIRFISKYFCKWIIIKNPEYSLHHDFIDLHALRSLCMAWKYISTCNRREKESVESWGSFFEATKIIQKYSRWNLHIFVES
jgi:hypothetical protein